MEHLGVERKREQGMEEESAFGYHGILEVTEVG